ncbi:MAG: dihydropteroate synthase [bacterium]
MKGFKGVIRLRDQELDCSSRTLVMGVLNVTPDSFSDGGRFYDPVKAIQHGLKMAKEGADIIDVGGESTRPGSEPISAQEEIKRVIPVIEALASEIQVPISIDTYKSEVAARALEAGAAILNDISALRFDPQMVKLVAEQNVPVILMHMLGTPKDMQLDPRYEDVVGEILDFLNQRIQWAMSYGVAAEQIIVDPGIGFGKTLEHNLTILKNLSKFRSLGRPILIGTSRKSFIGKILGADVDQREDGTAATVALGICNGANIVRVHDVARMVAVVRVTDAVMRAP